MAESIAAESELPESAAVESASAGPAAESTAPGSTESESASAGPAAESASAGPAAESAALVAAPAGRRRRTVVLALVGAATVALGCLGIWATEAARSLRGAGADANTALVDRAATRSVDRAVTRSVDVIFSYSYADTGRTRAAAQRLLTGAAIRQYDQLFALVEQQAPKEKLVVTTRVTSAGVELLTADRARVLVFANQQDSRAGTSQASYGGAMFAVTAVRQHGVWKIESIDTFTGPS